MFNSPQTSAYSTPQPIPHKGSVICSFSQFLTTQVPSPRATPDQHRTRIQAPGIRHHGRRAMLGTKPRAQRLLQRRARARRLPRAGDGALEAADPGGSCRCSWSSNRSLQGLDRRDSAAWRPARTVRGGGSDRDSA